MSTAVELAPSKPRPAEQAWETSRSAKGHVHPDVPPKECGGGEEEEEDAEAQSHVPLRLALGEGTGSGSSDKAATGGSGSSLRGGHGGPEETRHESGRRKSQVSVSHNTGEEADEVASKILRASVVGGPVGGQPEAKVAGDGGWWLASWTIDPASRWLAWWTVLVQGLALAQALTVPLRIAFGSLGEPYAWLALEVPTDLIFLADVVRGFFTPQSVDGHIVSDPAALRRVYMHRDFWWDAAAALPLGILSVSLGYPELRIPTLVKMRALLRRLHHWDQNPESSLAVVTSVRVLFFTLMLTHYTGCGWYAFRRFEDTDEGNLWLPDDALDRRPFMAKYLNALYFALASMKGVSRSEVTQGDIPQSTAEAVFSCAFILLGMLLFSYIVGSIDAIFNVQRANFEEHQKWSQSLSRYLSFHEMPAELQLRIHSYLEYEWAHSRGFHEQNSRMRVLGQLPQSLRIDAQAFLPCRVISESEFFDNLPEGFVSAAMSAAETVTCAPGEFVFRANDPADGIYFVQAGSGKVVAADGVSGIAMLLPGDMFGAYGVMLGTSRTASVVATTYLKLFRLTAPVLNDLLARYPSAKVALLERTRENRAQTRKKEDAIARAIRRGKMDWASQQAAGPDENVNVRFFPGSKFHVRYQLAVLVAAAYLLAAVPFEMVFFYYNGDRYLSAENSWPAIVFDAITDMFLIATLAVRLETGFSDQGELVMDRATVRAHYLRNGLVLNVLGSLPLDWLVWAATGVRNIWWRVPRLLWAAEIPALASAYIQHGGNANRRNTLRVIQHMAVVFFVGHYFACFYYTYTFFEGYGGNDWRMPDFVRGSWAVRQYFRSLFLSFSLLNSSGKVPAPVGDAEIFYTLSGLLVGIFLVAYLTGGVADIVANIDTFRTSHDKDHRFATEYFKFHGASRDFLKRVHQFFEQSWAKNRGVDPLQMMEGLPRSLRSSVLLEMFGRTIRHVPLFSGAPESFIEGLSGHASFVHVPQGEYIYRRGFGGSCMYLVVSGGLSLLLPVRIRDEGLRSWNRKKSSSVLGALQAFRQRKNSVVAFMAPKTDEFQQPHDECQEQRPGHDVAPALERGSARSAAYASGTTSGDVVSTRNSNSKSSMDGSVEVTSSSTPVGAAQPATRARSPPEEPKDESETASVAGDRAASPTLPEEAGTHPREQLAVAHSEGPVPLLAWGESVSEVVFQYLERGSFFGESEVLGNRVRQCSAMAETDCSVLVLDRDRVLDLLQVHPQIRVELEDVSRRRSQLVDELVVRLSVAQTAQQAAVTASSCAGRFVSSKVDIAADGDHAAGPKSKPVRAATSTSFNRRRRSTTLCEVGDLQTHDVVGTIHTRGRLANFKTRRSSVVSPVRRPSGAAPNKDH